MSPGVQAVVALVFVTVLGAVLIQPVLDAVDAPLPGPTPTESGERDPTGTRPNEEPATQSPSPSPSAEASGEISGSLRTQPLYDRFPRRCLSPAAPRSDRLVFVADRLAQTATNFEADASQGQVGASALVGLDVSATTYASYVKARDVLFAPWEGIAGADGARPGTRIAAAAWSPMSSCALALTSKGSLQVVPNGSILVRGGVRHFAFSPDGKKVAVIVQEGETTSTWVARLSGERLREVYRVQNGSPLRIEAWAPDGDTIYLTRSPDARLRFVIVVGSPQTGGVRGASDVQLEQCAGRLLGLLDGAVIEIPSWRGFLYVTERDDGAAYTSISCSPDGRFIAAVRDGSLVLLDRDGNLLRELTTDEGYRDIDPDWGQSGSGLLFGRVPDAGGSAQVWHIPEGGAPRNTGLLYDGRGAAAIDWSASPPTGLP